MSSPLLRLRFPMMETQAPLIPSAGMSIRSTWSSVAVFQGAMP